MAITGPASFVPTTEEFLKHWDAANKALPAEKPLACEGGVLRAALETLSGELGEAHGAVQDAVTDLALARGALDVLKARALLWLNRFNEKVRADLGSTHFARALPLVPAQTDGRELFLTPMDRAARVWMKIDAATIEGFTGPLELLEEVKEANFVQLIKDVRKAYTTAVNADTDVKLAREARNDLQEKIYPILKKYRETVPTRFARGTVMVDTLPVLTPEGGHTPEKPKAVGTWNAATGRGDVTFTPIKDADVKQYELRWSPGDTYSTDDESTLATVEPGGPAKFETLQGLDTPGAKSLFRVVVVLKPGNEAGSEPVEIVRPPAAG